MRLVSYIVYGCPKICVGSTSNLSRAIFRTMPSNCSAIVFRMQPRRCMTNFSHVVSPLSQMVGSFPTTLLCEQALIASHEYLHMPWVAGIFGLTTIVRLCCVPLDVKSQQLSRKNAFLSMSAAEKVPLIEEKIRQNLKKQGKFVSEQQIKKSVFGKQVEFLNFLLEKNDTTRFRPFAILFAYIPIFVSLMYSFRNVSNSEILFLEQQRTLAAAADFGSSGFLWIPSLAQPDPIFVIPAIMAVVSLAHFQLKRASIKDAKAFHRSMVKNPVVWWLDVPLFMMGIFSPLIIFASAILPAGVSLPLLFWNVISFGANLLLECPKVKNRLHIMPMPFDSPHPVKRFLSAFFFDLVKNQPGSGPGPRQDLKKLKS